MATETTFDPRRTTWKFGVLAAIFLAVVYLLPRPASVEPAGWRLFALFFSTVVGLILQPVPGGALVLLAVTLAPVLGGISLGKALGGYADTTVWLVNAAFFISRALLNTGLARRIALMFVRAFGKSPVGVCYALALTDGTLASIIPSNGARSGGVTLPIVRSICELYGSFPGESARKLGSYLMTAVYQCVCISTAMFLTGQASNPLAAKMASDFGYQVTWAGWFVAGLVPGLLSLAAVPRIVFWLNPPELRETPEAARYAAAELEQMGPMRRNEWILTAVFATVCGLWVTSGWHGLDITLTALCGSMALLLTGVLSYEDVIREKTAWDIFLWYGGLLQLAKSLNDAGVMKAFATMVGERFAALDWLPLLVLALLIYFYAHYAFASITAHILAMYPAFLALLMAKDAPVGLVVMSFACLTNLSAGLTHYGTTPAPMFFAHGYVSMKEWWRIGAAVSVVNLAIWGVVGFAWWKAIGLW